VKENFIQDCIAHVTEGLVQIYEMYAACLGGHLNPLVPEICELHSMGATLFWAAENG
jgi:hypothetical protein